MLTIDEAIKILTEMGTPDFRGHTEDILAARKLGIEALKRIKENRKSGIVVVFKALPGVTE